MSQIIEMARRLQEYEETIRDVRHPIDSRVKLARDSSFDDDEHPPEAERFVENVNQYAAPDPPIFNLDRVEDNNGAPLKAQISDLSIDEHGKVC